MKFFQGLLFLFIFSLLGRLSLSSSDEFQTTVEGFIDAFDETYSTELNYQTTNDENIDLLNEVSSTLDSSSNLEETLTAKAQDEQDQEPVQEPVQEDAVVTEAVFLPGSEVRHELSDEVRALAEKSLASINSALRLVNVIEAVSQVTDKVERSLRVMVTRTDCGEGESCEITCRLDLVNRNNEDILTWHNCLDSPASNELPRIKRGAIGGFKQVDEEEARELAEVAVQMLDSIDVDDNKRIVKQIIKAQKQLVNGIMYHLTMEVALTECKEGEEKCEGKIVDHQICKVLMQRLFAAETPNNAQVIKSECSPISQVKDTDNKKSQQRTKRHAVVEGSENNLIPDDKLTPTKTHSRSSRLLGGKRLQDPDSVKIREISEFALSEIDKSSNSLNKQMIIRVVDARSQVVAGTKYYLRMELVETNCKKGSDQEKCNPAANKAVQSCDVVVWEKPWEKFRHVSKVNCYPVENRKKRGIPGGRSPADVNDARVQEMAQFAVSQLDARSNSLNAQKLVLVKEAQTQVVAGTNYFLKLQLVETNCPKGSASIRQCSAGPNQVVQECDVVVYDRPWDKHRELTSAKCSPAPSNQRVTRQLLGGKQKEDVNSPEVKEMAEYAVSQLSARSNSPNKQKLVQVKDAQVQVVAGVNYFLKLQLVETNCRKGSLGSESCTAAKDKLVQECDVVVYERAWEKHRELTSAKCSTPSNGKSRQKRDVMVGGKAPQNTDSDEIQELAHFAVEDLNKKSNAMYKQTLVQVISAHTQVVSGINYHLKLKIAESNCKKSELKSTNCSPKGSGPSQECDVTIWSQPWLKKREVTKSECKPSEEKKVISGPKSVDPNSVEVQEAAKVALKTIDRRSNSMFKHAVVEVTDAKVQTVSGKKYFLTMVVGQSECRKGDNSENCALQEANTMNDRCNVVVWSRPWLNKTEVVDVNCGRRTKREITKDVHLSMFEEFKNKYNKVYGSEQEHQKRFRIFRANLKKIQYLQANEQGTATYGPNMFADLSAVEFKRLYTGLKSGPAPRPSSHHMRPAAIPDVELPVDFDWRDHGAVTPVKNQGMCGSCWAFSVTGNIEGQWAIKHNQLLSLSEQELVDCDKTDNGCNGGYMTQAYEAIEKIGGLETEDEYPYDAKDESCKFNSSASVQVTVSSSVNITTNETEIAQWLYTNGPISIGINANAMQFYMGGVSHPFKFLCDKNNLDHGVLLVGFGVHRTSIRHKMLPYWLIKNSWGPHWGEKGYYRVYRGDSTCGVNQMCSSAIVD